MRPIRDGGRDRKPTLTAPREVEVVCEAFLDLCDEAMPGAVEGLYLHGSLGFGEWLAHTSDIDFVAVSSQRLDPDVLRGIHLELQGTFPSPSFDGPHLTWADLARSAAMCPDVPCTLGGVWDDEGRVDVSPVTWHALAGHSLTIRGPAPGDIALLLDRTELRQFTHDNLAGYWADLVAGLANFPAEAAKPELVTWTVLGTARLRHLLRYDELTSKIGAGVQALAEFGDRWEPLIDEAICWREHGVPTGEYDGREDQRAADTIEFCRLMVDSGVAIRV